MNENEKITETVTLKTDMTNDFYTFLSFSLSLDCIKKKSENEIVINAPFMSHYTVMAVVQKYCDRAEMHVLFSEYNEEEAWRLRLGEWYRKEENGWAKIRFAYDGHFLKKAEEEIRAKSN